MDPSSPRSTRHTQWQVAAAAGGVLSVLTLLAAPMWLEFGPFASLSGLIDALASPQVGPWLWWGFAGAALLGAAVGGAFGRDHLVAPALIVAVVYAGAIHRTWVALQGPAPPLPGTPYDLTLVGWPVTLALAAVAGIVERRVRAARDSGETWRPR